jgi:exonuclease VII large subunit
MNELENSLGSFKTKGQDMESELKQKIDQLLKEKSEMKDDLNKLGIELDSANNICSERLEEFNNLKNINTNLENQLEQSVSMNEMNRKEMLENSSELKSLQNQLTIHSPCLVLLF